MNAVKFINIKLLYVKSNYICNITKGERYITIGFPLLANLSFRDIHNTENFVTMSFVTTHIDGESIF